jgi:hypothetical protein
MWFFPRYPKSTDPPKVDDLRSGRRYELTLRVAMGSAACELLPDASYTLVARDEWTFEAEVLKTLQEGKPVHFLGQTLDVIRERVVSER